MALRVLLADESSTIKKVFQLALQDFAVEVRPVNVGVDVVPVAQSFKPDIIFADVLLQKRSGYEVAAEVKQDSSLKGVPVVLMWSGFMELDQDKFDASMANGQLEKPFDVAALRKLVTDLVPRTQSQRLSQFLAFPNMPEIEEKPKTPPPPPPEAINEEFSQVPLPKMKSSTARPSTTMPPPAPAAKPSASGGDKYRLNLKPEEMESDHVPVEYDLPSEKIEMQDVLKPEEFEDEPFAIKETRRSAKPTAPPQVQQTRPPIPLETEQVEASEMLNLEDLVVEDEEDTPLGELYRPPVPSGTSSSIGIPAPHTQGAISAPGGGLSAEQLEKIIREQSTEVIESVVWKVVPDLAAQIIERELNKLLKERESQPY